MIILETRYRAYAIDYGNDALAFVGFSTGMVASGALSVSVSLAFARDCRRSAVFGGGTLTCVRDASELLVNLQYKCEKECPLA